MFRCRFFVPIVTDYDLIHLCKNDECLNTIMYYHMWNHCRSDVGFPYLLLFLFPFFNPWFPHFVIIIILGSEAWTLDPVSKTA